MTFNRGSPTDAPRAREVELPLEHPYQRRRQNVWLPSFACTRSAGVVTPLDQLLRLQLVEAVLDCPLAVNAAEQLS